MNSKLKIITSTLVVVLVNGCSAHSEEDYGTAEASKRESKCINIDPAQETKCKER
jgi:hypothetical protein